MEISFHIPNANTQFVGDENRLPPQVFREKIMLVADVGTGVEEAIVTFEGIAITTPSFKGLRIMNLAYVRTADSVAKILQNHDDDAVDPHLEHIKNEAGVDESDDEDEDFVIDKDDRGSPTDDSGEEESDASESGDEKDISHFKPAKKDQRKEAVVAAAASFSKESKKKGRDGQDDGKKKKMKKKDSNAQRGQ
ncbi:hypothetical protein PVK06_020779 [Gossypium arboreum]|uniref:Uncharacterized protein n=1 Tax=Gossypium arboreum TaxID=29729 RepID=A0ABR0PN92_GOSAR|nr:hypothetical protein PVK06_020779 [Gossypium arboreum]